MSLVVEERAVTGREQSVKDQIGGMLVLPRRGGCTCGASYPRDSGSMERQQTLHARIRVDIARPNGLIPGLRQAGVVPGSGTIPEG